MEQQTTLKVFVDGFGGMAVTGIEGTHSDVLKGLNDDGVWDLLDRFENNDRGEYEVTMLFWWESNYPEPGDGLLVKIDKFERLGV